MRRYPISIAVSMVVALGASCTKKPSEEAERANPSAPRDSTAGPRSTADVLAMLASMKLGVEFTPLSEKPLAVATNTLASKEALRVWHRLRPARERLRLFPVIIEEGFQDSALE